MSDPMITKTPLNILYINSKIENYTLPLLDGNNGYEAAEDSLYPLNASPNINTQSSTQTPTMNNSITLNSLSDGVSSETSKIYYDNSDIGINVTKGEYYQADFNATCIIFGSTPTYQVNDSSGVSQNWVFINSTGPTLIIDASSDDFMPGGYSFQIHTLYDTHMFTQNLIVIGKPCLISDCSQWQSETVWKQCTDEYQLSSDVWISNSSTTDTNTTNQEIQEEHLEKDVDVALQSVTISVGISSAAGSLASLSSPQGLWFSINQQQMMLLLLLTKVYVSQKVVDYLKGINFLSMSFGFLKFESVPPFKQLIEWISFDLKTPELTNYDIKYGWSLHNTLSLIILMLIWLVVGIIILLFWFRAQKKQHTKCGKIINKYKYVFVFSPVIRLYLESFLFFAIVSIEEIRHIDFVTLPKLVSFCIAWVLLSLSFIMCSASICKCCMYKGIKTGIPSEDMFCELFSGLKSTYAARLYTTWFMVKRLVFASIIILLFNKTLLLKLVMMVCIQIADTIFIFLVRPSNFTRYNIIECLNQLFLLIILGSFLIINKKSDWNQTITNIFIYCLLSNSAIILLIIL